MRIFVMIITLAFSAHWSCSLISMQWCCYMSGNAGECYSLASFRGITRFPLYLMSLRSPKPNSPTSLSSRLQLHSSHPYQQGSRFLFLHLSVHSFAHRCRLLLHHYAQLLACTLVLRLYPLAPLSALPTSVSRCGV